MVEEATWQPTVTSCRNAAFKDKYQGCFFQRLRVEQQRGLLRPAGPCVDNHRSKSQLNREPCLRSTAVLLENSSIYIKMLVNPEEHWIHFLTSGNRHVSFGSLVCYIFGPCKQNVRSASTARCLPTPIATVKLICDLSDLVQHSIGCSRQS